MPFNFYLPQSVLIYYNIIMAKNGDQGEDWLFACNAMQSAEIEIFQRKVSPCL
jgi:hypothetical protein